MIPPQAFRLLFNWLGARTLASVEKTVVDEAKRRLETGELGDYDGILFKDAFRSRAARDRIVAGGVDVGIVAATERSLVGALDKMSSSQTTKGNGFKYTIGVWKKRRVAVVETGIGLDAARRGTEALLQAFRPARVAKIGFVRPLVDSLKPGSLFVPNRLVREDGTVWDLDRPRLSAPDEPPKEAAEAPTEPPEPTDETEPRADAEPNPEAESSSSSEPKPSVEPTRASLLASELLKRFATGALLTLDRKVEVGESKELAKRYGATAVDRGTWAIAEVCSAAGVPFLPLFVARDVRAEAGSKEAARAVASQGKSAARTLGAFLGAVTKKPSSALHIYQLKERSLEAADKLAKALDAILASVRE